MAKSANIAQNIGNLSDEMTKMEYEPILPVEKKLVLWSVVLGFGLLGFLYWLSVTLFPTGH